MMTTQLLRKLVIALTSASCLAGAGPLAAEPEVTALALSELAGGTVTLLGSGFGSKAQPAPVLFDLGDRAFENGQLNTYQSTFFDGQQIARLSEDPKTLWEKPSIGDGLSVYVTSSRPGRSADSRAHYYFSGENAFLGWPTAYGGTATPQDNSKLYVAWWYKPKYTPREYWAFSPIEKQGSFVKGEPISIGGVIRGKYIGTDKDGLLNAELSSTKDIKGAIVKGMLSGATSVFPTEFRGGSGIGYETPGSQKYIRIWDGHSEKEGLRISWTQMHQTGLGGPNWGAAPVEGGQWNLLELELDLDQGRLETFVNSGHFSTYEFDPQLVESGQGSPTIALLGLNGKVGKLQEGEIDDIYMDKSLQRVVVGNAPQFSEVTHYELQHPKSWSDGKIEFELRLGALKSNAVYVYVYDEAGRVNENGYPICSICSPPVRIGLDIQ